MAVDQPKAVGLPKTIEEATRRYIHYYRQNYRGPAYDEYRLANMTKAFIHDLRKCAPKFYDEKLPTFVNQACSTLLLFNTTNEEECKKFHQQHAMFLVMLQEFKKSQPIGEISFHSELTRLQEKSDLMQEQTTLQKRLEELEAYELSTDDIGEEEDTNEYTRICDELDKVKSKLQAVSYKIALLEGLETEQEAHFELHVKPRSTLSRLSKEQLQKLERQMLEHVKASNNKPSALYMDISIIDGMIANLNIDHDMFKKEELRHIAKDALDAYKEYFRKIEMSLREENFEQLLKSPHLLPKEGDIIKSPDDIPEEVKVKLEQHSKRSHNELSEILQTFGDKPCAEDQLGDLLDDDGDEEDYRTKLREEMRLKGIACKRVKEEPRDDCDLDDMSSDQEIEVDCDVARALVDQSSIATYAPPPKMDDYLVMDREDEEAEDGQEQYYEDDDDDIECLGTIEPEDKIKTFQVDD